MANVWGFASFGRGDADSWNFVSPLMILQHVQGVLHLVSNCVWDFTSFHFFVFQANEYIVDQMLLH